jgi:hypothetical protein
MFRWETIGYWQTWPHRGGCTKQRARGRWILRNYNEFLGLKAPQSGRMGRRILGKLTLRGPFFTPETIGEYDKTASTRFMMSRGLQPAPRLQTRGNDSQNSTLNKAEIGNARKCMCLISIGETAKQSYADDDAVKSLLQAQTWKNK